MLFLRSKSFHKNYPFLPYKFSCRTKDVCENRRRRKKSNCGGCFDGKDNQCTQATCTASFDKRQDTHACSRGLTKRRFSDNYETLFIKSQIMQLTLIKRFVSSSSST
ncbi:hypothetical protein OIU78_019195 [Salix suchowensis]|nr:hypothetical protein OIU78_019195 [Salix suchowensis]